MLSNMMGVTSATVKSECQPAILSQMFAEDLLMSQLTAEEIDIPLARMSRGNTSADTTQASGPQVVANQVMYQ